MFSTAFWVAATGLGFASGFAGWSFWWAVLASALAGGFAISEAPTCHFVMNANSDDRLRILVRLIFYHALLVLGSATLAGLVGRAFS